MVKRLRTPTQGTRSRIWRMGSFQRQHPREAHHLAWMFGSAMPWIARTSLSKTASMVHAPGVSGAAAPASRAGG